MDYVIFQRFNNGFGARISHFNCVPPLICFRQRWKRIGARSEIRSMVKGNVGSSAWLEYDVPGTSSE